jgi:secondary thiamine-phosphate synthase enzyme
MHQAIHRLSVATNGKGLIEITEEVRRWVHGEKIITGLLILFCRHTSASLLIQENADPSVQTDLKNYFEDLVPETRHYLHDSEGRDDMSAHIRAALTSVHLAIPVDSGELVLGRWQGIYLFEHRRAPNLREVVMYLSGNKDWP